MTAETHGSYIFVTNAENDSLHDGTFEIICPTICLTKNMNEKSIHASGPGKIWVARNGNIYFEIFLKWNDHEQMREWVRQLDFRRGRLSATDSWGRSWQSKDALEDYDVVGHHFLPSGFSIIRGSLLNLVFVADPSKETDPQPDWIELRYHFKGKLPFNEFTDLNETSAGELSPLGTKRNVLQFQLEAFQIRLRADEDKKLLIATIKTSTQVIPDNFETYFSQCLQFVCGRMMTWYLKRQRSANRLSVTIIPTDHRIASLVTEPPITFNPWGYEDFTKLFALYWKFIEQEPETERHPVSGLMVSILFAGDALLETQVLTLCTALERLSLLLDESDIEPLTPDAMDFYQDILVEYRKLFRQKANVAKIDKDELNNLKSRSLTLLNMIKTPNALARLRHLVNKGVIKAEQVEVWKTYRDRLAHGNRLGKEIQEIFDAKGELLSTFYQIVFYLVGYSGKSL